jgi:hypothetical protein
MRSMYRSHVGEIFSLGERILEIDARVVLEEEKELSSSARDRLASNRRHLDRLAIFSPFRGSNRVVDCSVAREKGNKDRDRDQLVLAASREIPTSGNRPSRLATGTEIERSGMGGGGFLLPDAYRHARGSPSLYRSRSYRPFSRRTLPHGRSSRTKGRRKQGESGVVGTRTKRDERERSRTSAVEGHERHEGGTVGRVKR